MASWRVQRQGEDVSVFAATKYGGGLTLKFTLGRDTLVNGKSIREATDLEIRSYVRDHILNQAHTRELIARLIQNRG